MQRTGANRLAQRQIERLRWLAPVADLFVRREMRTFLAILLVALACGCASNGHGLDGKRVVLEGRWKSFAKEEGQIVCNAEPKIVDFVGTKGRPTPENGQVVRVGCVIHWRSTTEQEKRSAEQNAYQLPPDGYFIDWSKASWQPQK